MRRARCLIIIVLAAVSIGACRDDDATRPVDAVREFVSALERTDGAAVCRRLAEAGVSELLLAAVRANVDAVRSVESRDGRFRIRVAQQRDTSRLLLKASAPNREPVELSVKLTRGPQRGANG